MKRKPLKTHPVAPIPKSLPRDMVLYTLRKANPRLASTIVRSTVTYMPRKKIIRATIDFDPETYLKVFGG